MRTFSLALAILVAVPSLAHAEIRQETIVALAVKLAPAQAKAAHAKRADLAKAGIQLFDDPSLTQDPQPSITTYAGRVLASNAIERNKPTAITVTVPTMAEIVSLKKLLVAQHLPDTVQVIALQQFSGGK